MERKMSRFPLEMLGLIRKPRQIRRLLQLKNELIGGNVASATKLQTARTISLTGGVTGSVAFDGTANVSLAATVPPNSHAHTIANVTGLQTTLDGKTNVRGHSNGTVTQISNVNLNDFVESGVFMGSTMTNAPDTGWWYIQNMVHNANYVTQVAYRLNSTDQRIRIRIKNNGTWQAWQTCMLSTDNAPTATRLATARTISLTGGVTGSTTFDGSGNASIAATVAGNAPSASRLATPRTISLTGGATGSVSFDGSNNVSLATTLSGNAPTATRLATPRMISLTGGVTGSTNFDGSGNASIAATVDVIDIQHATGSNITVVPKWDCTAEINVQLAGWGFGGGKWTVGINTPSGTNQVVSGAGVIDGSDNIFRHISYASIFTGLKQGQSYRFERTTLEGQIGRADNGLIIAKLYRTG
ncbi:pyocin knob domain-containing protein [Enterococcus casseliflavus]|uniref:pyocin knob domain-containing protein n=1 Tax=Enterococcus casseliflavus TaxID=37734 RepID=UPI001BD0A9AD|nr:pyocin knob domain-containing protein [Enterococcus casseliflavus]